MYEVEAGVTGDGRFASSFFGLLATESLFKAPGILAQLMKPTPWRRLEQANLEVRGLHILIA
jgi:hypothetical protein